MGPIINFFPQMCGSCKGTGITRNININCSNCGSTGNTSKEMDINIYVPKGVENGKEYFFEGWGEQAIKDNEISGNFIIRIDIENHPLFKRKNNLDLIYTTQINVFETIVGKVISIPMLDETFTLDIKQFGLINPHKEYLIMKKGLVDEDINRGNLIVKFEIIYDNNLKLGDEEIIKIKRIFNEFHLI